VIAYAACIGDPAKFEQICLPGLRRVTEPDDLVIEAEHESSIFAAYNEVLDAVRERDDLEMLVLLHEDTEVVEPDFRERLRSRLAEPDVAIVGAVGARGVDGLSWWEGECFGRLLETRGIVDFGGGTHDVDTVDGLVMALSPWAVRNLRFDESAYSGFDAYDADLCAQARAAGKRVVVTELPVIHRHSRMGIDRAVSDGGSFERNDVVYRAKWHAPLEVAKAPRTRRTEDDRAHDGYFEHTRPELRELVPTTARRVLDVGCASGGFGAALKGERPGLEVVGLEGEPEAAERARTRLDGALCVDLNVLEEAPDGQFDTIVFADVLEHLRDPARLVHTLLPSLAEDGVLVLSIPNVKHWSVLYPLLVGDRWAYDDHGLLDRTHVHFFTARDAAAMLDRLGLEIVRLEVNDHAPLPRAMEPLAAVAAALGADRAEAAARLGAYQYLLVARRKAMAGFEPPAPADEPAGGIENADDPVAYLRELAPPEGEFTFRVPNVKHWSVLAPLLVDDRWGNGPRWRFTLDEVSDLLDEAGLEGTAVAPGEWVPLPPHFTPLLDLAAAAGAEREETLLRLGARDYLVSAQLKRATAD
jgi:2-polyprenyl-3-methyl-5-hydroxy-6-metoxy-1,4-benzoquinol methylase